MPEALMPNRDKCSLAGVWGLDAALRREGGDQVASKSLGQVRAECSIPAHC